MPRTPNHLYVLKDGDSFVVADTYAGMLDTWAPFSIASGTGYMVDVSLTVVSFAARAPLSGSHG